MDISAVAIERLCPASNSEKVASCTLAIMIFKGMLNHFTEVLMTGYEKDMTLHPPFVSPNFNYQSNLQLCSPPVETYTENTAQELIPY